MIDLLIGAAWPFSLLCAWQAGRVREIDKETRRLAKTYEMANVYLIKGQRWAEAYGNATIDSFHGGKRDE